MNIGTENNTHQKRFWVRYITTKFPKHVEIDQQTNEKSYEKKKEKKKELTYLATMRALFLEETEIQLQLHLFNKLHSNKFY